MKCLVTGYNGQLGYDVVKELERRNIECRGIDKNELDLTKKDDVYNYVKNYNPLHHEVDFLLQIRTCAELFVPLYHSL